MLAVFICCGLGALWRYALRPINQASQLPLGTLAANLIVALAVGYLSVSRSLPANWTSYLLYGLGGLGTYSSLTNELLSLRQKPVLALLYLMLTYGLGLLGLFLGQVLAG